MGEPTLYFAGQDDSSHWYVVPVSMREEWRKFRELDWLTDLTPEQDAIADKMEEFRLSGGIGEIEFFLPSKG